MRSLISAIAVLLVSGLILSGCYAKKPVVPKGDDARIVAKINNYEMTVADFKGEARTSLYNLPRGGDPIKAKRELLDNLITKKILIQEAQRENFDKEKSFMKEIERYWEQALLKLLLKKRTEEFSRSVTVDERDIKPGYSREDALDDKIQSAIDNWVADLKKKADIKIDEEVIKDVDIKQ